MLKSLVACVSISLSRTCIERVSNTWVITRVINLHEGIPVWKIIFLRRPRLDIAMMSCVSSSTGIFARYVISRSLSPRQWIISERIKGAASKSCPYSAVSRRYFQELDTPARSAYLRHLRAPCVSHETIVSRFRGKVRWLRNIRRTQGGGDDIVSASRFRTKYD